MPTRTESDSLGSIKVPSEAYYGAQTARHLRNFQIGSDLIPIKVIDAYSVLKKACALTNAELGSLAKNKANTIAKVCDEILEGKLDGHFPASVWQTGSGTHTNMNVNEVISNRAIEMLKGKIGSKDPIHPNDDVNMGQSSNDTFPTAMHIAAAVQIKHQLLPSLKQLQKTFEKQSKKWSKVTKIGRTHLMDAVPVTFGQEISAYAILLEKNVKRIESILKELYLLPIGGTAVGSGLNTKKGFDTKVCQKIAKWTKLPFKPARNKFEGISAHDTLVAASGLLATASCALAKIAQDIRLLNSGPRCGLSEITIPANEPGSSAMPGKVNPTQAEALLMICAQVKGNHIAILEAANIGELQLNIGKPVIIYNLLQQIELLSDGCNSFHDNCIKDMKPNVKNMKKHMENSLMLVTYLIKHIGYDQAAKVAKKAFDEDISLKEAVSEMKIMSGEEFEKIIQL